MGSSGVIVTYSKLTLTSTLHAGSCSHPQPRTSTRGPDSVRWQESGWSSSVSRPSLTFTSRSECRRLWERQGRADELIDYNICVFLSIVLSVAPGFSSIVICFVLAWAVPFWTVHPDRTGQDPYHVSALPMRILKVFWSLEADKDDSGVGAMTERRSGTRKSHRPLFPPAVVFRPHVRVPISDFLFVFVISQGLAFSVKKGVAVPPSLRNMYKELENEYSGEFKAPKHG
jgi:hypothetical protein